MQSRNELALYRLLAAAIAHIHTLNTEHAHKETQTETSQQTHPITSLPPPPIVLPLPEPESLDSKLKCFDELIQQLESTVEAQKKEIQV